MKRAADRLKRHYYFRSGIHIKNEVKLHLCGLILTYHQLTEGRYSISATMFKHVFSFLILNNLWEPFNDKRTISQRL